MVTLLDYMFGQRELKRVYLHTLEWNIRAQRCFAKCGFNSVRPIRRLSQDFLLMEVLRQDWLENGEQRLAARGAIPDRKSGTPVNEPGQSSP